MDHVSGTERFMELSSRGCKSPCPARYKAPVQPGVGERKRSPPSDPQLSAGSRPSQVGPRARRQRDLGSGDRGRGPTRLPPLLLFPRRGRDPQGWLFPSLSAPPPPPQLHPPSSELETSRPQIDLFSQFTLHKGLLKLVTVIFDVSGPLLESCSLIFQDSRVSLGLHYLKQHFLSPCWVLTLEV